MASGFHIVFGVLAILGTGLLIASAATNYWRGYELLSLKYHQGIFKRCTSTTSMTNCGKLYEDFGDLPAKFAGIVATMILAILFGGLVLIVGLVAAMSDKKLTGFIAILQILSVVASVSGLAMYAKYYSGGVWKLGWSYAVGWAGAGLLGVGIVVIIVIMIR